MAEHLDDHPGNAVAVRGPRELLDPRDARAQPPEDPVALRSRPPPQVAGGIPAIVASAKHALPDKPV